MLVSLPQVFWAAAAASTAMSGFIGGGGRDLADQRFGRRVVDRDQRIAGRFNEVTINKVSLESHVHRPSLFLSSSSSLGI